MMFKWLSKILYGCAIVLSMTCSMQEKAFSQTIATDTTLSILTYNLDEATTDTARINAQLALGLFYINKPETYAKDIEKSVFFTKQAYMKSREIKYLAGERKACVIFSQIYREQKILKTGMFWADKALALVNAGASSKEIATACFEKANYYGYQSDEEFAQKLIYFERAVAQMRIYGRGSIDLANSLKFLADLHNMQGNGSQSLAELEEALVIYRDHKYSQLQDVYMLMGYIYNLMENTEQSLHYNLLAVKTVEKNKDTSATALAAYNRLGIVYIGMNDPVRAFPILDKGYKLAGKQKDYPALASLAVNLSWVYLKRSKFNDAIVVLENALKYCPSDMEVGKTGIYAKLIEAYTLKKQYATATKYYKVVAEHAIDTSYSEVTALNLRFAALNLFIESRNLKEVPPILAATTYTANKTKLIRVLAATEELKYKFELLKGNYRDALRHHELFKTYDDSLSKRNYDKQLIAMELQYKTAQKDEDLLQKSNDIRLLTKHNELQEKDIKNHNIIRNISGIAIVLLILVLLAGISRYNLQVRTSRRLEVKQEEINNQNHNLKLLLNEREWLLKEIHHRVKNNLQIVISLLNSQSIYLNNPDAVNILKESQNRIFSISLIHQKLYQEQTLAGIKILEYIKELAAHLSDSFTVRGRVTFEVDAEDLLLDVSEAVPLGLIMNEAMTNSIKYAFPNNGEGQISISLKSEKNNYISFEISDNGVGLSSLVQIEDPKTLGLTLIKGLSDQLGAEFEMDRSAGVKYSLKWQSSKLIIADATIKSITQSRAGS